MSCTYVAIDRVPNAIIAKRQWFILIKFTGKLSWDVLFAVIVFQFCDGSISPPPPGQNPNKFERGAAVMIEI